MHNNLQYIHVNHESSYKYISFIISYNTYQDSQVHRIFYNSTQSVVTYTIHS